MSYHRWILCGAAFVFGCFFAVGCSKPEEKKPDPDALKKELEELNKARKKEWGQ